MALLMVACGGEDSGAPSQPGQGGGAGTPSIVSLQVTPAQGHIPVGFEQQFTAEATMSDGTVKDVTADARLSWSSGDAAIATIDNADRKGLAKGIKAGTVTITASGVAADGKTVSATAQLEVTDAHVSELQVTPSTATVAAGLEQAFIATAILSDGSALDVTTFTGLSWSSSAPTIATIDNVDRKGVATGVTPGTVTITASGAANGTPFSATAELTVSDAHVTALQVTPATISVPAGLEQQFTATAFLSDGTSQDVTTFAGLSWSSSDTSIATINNTDKKGLATGMTVGITTITASGTANGTPFSATAQLTVTNATVTSLQVTPATATVPVGFEQQFVAQATMSDGTVHDVTTDARLSWSSSAPAIATISSTGTSDKGLATGVAVGTTTITASGSVNGTSFSATAELTVTDTSMASLQVTPANAAISVGLDQQFIATAFFFRWHLLGYNQWGIFKLEQ
ncbi:Bacterial Ig-like domain (group 2) [compost metagenome]